MLSEFNIHCGMILSISYIPVEAREAGAKRHGAEKFPLLPYTYSVVYNIV